MLHGSHPPLGFFATTLAWTLMMAVMMTPTVGPWIGAYHRFAVAYRGLEPRVWPTAVFAGGYVAVWAGFSALVAMAQTFIHLPAGYGGVLLIVAGVFQLSPLKQACLSHCRNPLSFLLARWQHGPMPAFQLGLLHGAYCVGCCWALMLTAFAVGVMSLWWMAALTLITFVEQVVPWGARVRVPVGIVLIAAGIVW
jgi:predicted metal-binding membrane protein